MFLVGKSLELLMGSSPVKFSEVRAPTIIIVYLVLFKEAICSSF